MTESEYIFSGCHNFNCEFTLKDGRKLPGLVLDLFPDTELGVYYYVPTNKLIEFKKYNESRDNDKMRTICRKIDLADIVSCARIYP